MKRLITVLLTCVCLMSLVACNNESMSTAGDVGEEKQQQYINRFNSSKWGMNCSIITDNATGVQYLFVTEYRSDGFAGGLSVLVDAEGNPFIKQSSEGVE